MHKDTTLVNNKIIRINNIKICSLKANNEDEKHLLRKGVGFAQ